MTDPARAKHLPLVVHSAGELAITPRSPLDEPASSSFPSAKVIAIRERAREHDRKRNLRARAVRPLTIPAKQARRELALGRRALPETEDLGPRPKTRADCAGVARPCPFVSCRHHLYLEVGISAHDAIKLNFPDLEPDELAESCSLDVAERGGETLDAVGRMLNVTRERARQLENRALGKMRERGPLRQFAGEPAPFGRLGVKGDREAREELQEEDEDDGEELAPGPLSDLEAEFDVATFLALEDPGPEAA